MMQHIQDLIATARPGTRIRIIEVEVPGTPDGQVLLVETNGGGYVDAAADEHLRAAGHHVLAAEQRLRHLHDLAPEPLTVSEWPRVIDAVWMRSVSARELKRAVAAGALEGWVKGQGKDHRATIIGPDRMARYLTLCDAVQHGHEPRPPWWNTVRRGSNADICLREAA